MPLLVLTLVAPLLVFFIMLAGCALLMRREARRDERRQEESAERRAWEQRRRQASRPRRRFAVIPAQGAFEAEQAPLWDTQVPAIQLISAAGYDGLHEGSLKANFLAQARRYPELYEGAEFEDWLEFLEAAGVARRNLGTITITHMGREFLLFQEQRHWTRRG